MSLEKKKWVVVCCKSDDLLHVAHVHQSQLCHSKNEKHSSLLPPYSVHICAHIVVSWIFVVSVDILRCYVNVLERRALYVL